jgi:hypothetical protein
MMWFAFALILAVVGYYSWKSVEAPAPLMKKPEAPKNQRRNMAVRLKRLNNL